MIKITNDVFDIASRIKNINSNYELYYDGKFKLYANNILQLVLPFESLDSRTYDYILKTQIKNLESLQKEIDLNNEKVVEKKERKQKQDRDDIIKELAKIKR